MNARVFLIAEREFRTYVATVSFWIALIVGPLLLATTAIFIGRTQAALPVHVSCANTALRQSAISALADAAALENHRFIFVDGKGAVVQIRSGGERTTDLTFDDTIPLSAAGRAYVAMRLERDISSKQIATRDSPVFHVRVTAATAPSVDGAALSRLALVTILWLVLTGSLGMLLQAIVRERSIRALESLLAAASPWEIAMGKLLGIGAVSLLVLSVWLGSASALAVFIPGQAAVASSLTSAFTSPLLLIRALAIYFIAYAFYGFTTLFIGATARDSASAQNLSRPMFVTLLTAFFVSFASVSGSGADISSLLYIPPFAPFALLLKAPGDYSFGMEFTAFALLVVSTILAARLAVGRITIASESHRRGVFRRLREALVG